MAALALGCRAFKIGTDSSWRRAMAALGLGIGWMLCLSSGRTAFSRQMAGNSHINYMHILGMDGSYLMPYSLPTISASSPSVIIFSPCQRL